jgi:hypothetical protein
MEGADPRQGSALADLFPLVKADVLRGSFKITLAFTAPLNR